MFSLTDQIRRSSRSVGAQIAEAWAKRKYEKHFVSKLTDADGEQLETQHWIEVASDCCYLSQEAADNVLQNLRVYWKNVEFHDRAKGSNLFARSNPKNTDYRLPDH